MVQYIKSCAISGAKAMLHTCAMGGVTETIPMQRFGTTAEFAAAATFLASERASYITGQSLAVDGGWFKGN